MNHMTINEHRQLLGLGPIFIDEKIDIESDWLKDSLIEVIDMNTKKKYWADDSDIKRDDYDKNIEACNRLLIRIYGIQNATQWLKQ